MTVCIAATCENGAAVVVASDRMLSAPFLTVEFDHQDAKIDEIGHRCVALSSGDALCVQDVLIGGKAAASQIQNPTISTLAEQIKVQFKRVREQQINDLVLGPRGIDFESFYAGGMISRFPPDLAMLLDSQVQRHSLQTTILVAGVDGAGAHIFNIEDPGAMSSFDRLGYHAIGSGHRHAVLKMVGMGQHKSMSLNETVFNVYCAKRVAELAPGVGQATSMKIVTADGITPLEQGTLEQMEPAYKAQEKPELAAVKKVIEKLPFGKESPHATE